MMQQSGQPNLYEFTGDAQITYQPSNADGVPELDYQDDEYANTFTGSDIRIQQNVFGTMLTVTLQIRVDVGDIKVSLFLPYVTVADNCTAQNFDTRAIKTQSTSNLLRPGPTLSYEVLSLQGSAQLVEF